MTQFLAAGSALILVIILSVLGKKPKSLQNKSSLSKSLTLAPIALRIKKKKSKLLKKTDESPLVHPQNPQEKILLRKKMFTLISLGPEERLDAIKLASQWGDPSTLPILRIGLKDSESNVVLLAAEAIEKFKGSTLLNKTQRSERLPRNVFLMR